MANSGVYCITNAINGNKYIGSAVDIKGRWRGHKRRLNKNSHHSGHLQNAWNKYGADNFEFTVLERCEIDYLIRCEQFYIDREKPVYNVCQIAGSCLGVKRSEETKRKNSVAAKGNTNWLGKQHTDETRLKMSGENNPNFGKHLSEEQKRKISERIVSDEARRNMSAAHKGKPNGRLGKHHTEEARAKMSVSAKRRCAQTQPQVEVA